MNAKIIVQELTEIYPGGNPDLTYLRMTFTAKTIFPRLFSSHLSHLKGAFILFRGTYSDHTLIDRSGDKCTPDVRPNWEFANDRRQESFHG